jgi:hypothetical protein
MNLCDARHETVKRHTQRWGVAVQGVKMRESDRASKREETLDNISTNKILLEEIAWTVMETLERFMI